MPLVPMKQVLDEARKGGYGVGAYNVNNMEQIQALMQGAPETRSPIILQASRPTQVLVRFLAGVLCCVTCLTHTL